MTEHHSPEPPSSFTYAVGVGLGALIGGAVGLFLGGNYFLPSLLIGAAVGIIVSHLVKAFMH
ncbi:hypothetical protein [Aeromicrobium sp.]|uniref:hypothetical protein n=1 Tax=Aeromicrobium sp. TaxID=1871063 RepID=UPI003C4F7618